MRYYTDDCGSASGLAWRFGYPQALVWGLACEAQCATYCGQQGAQVFDAACEGFCTKPPHDPCTRDIDCLPDQGSCGGKDGLSHGNICGCECLALGGAASKAGGLQCNLGTNINIELNSPCGDGDILIALGQRCIPLTTEAITSQLHNTNNTTGKDFPLGASPASGEPVGCSALATSTTTGLVMVGSVNFFDSTIGDIQTNETFTCQ